MLKSFRNHERETHSPIEQLKKGQKMVYVRLQQILAVRRVQLGKSFMTSKSRNKSTIADSASSPFEAVEAPTSQQLSRLFWNAAIPMIGFGFMDQTVMLQAGNAIDCTIGVTFGLSTLTAAAFGQVCSDAAGVMFGGTVESIASKAGIPKAGLTAAQRQLSVVKKIKFAGGLFGIITGCLLGLVNLLWIDTERSSTLKLQVFNEEQEFEYSIEASNAANPDVTTLKVRGPDVDGMLASMTAALAVRGCSLVQLHAKRAGVEGTDAFEDNETKLIEDVFYVVDRETGKPYEDDELETLARDLLDSTRTPMNVNSVKATINELEDVNLKLRDRVRKLEEVVAKKQIKIVPATGE